MFFKKFILILIILNGLHLSVFSQEKNESYTALPLKEKVFFSTDRTLYIAGETILFKANCLLSLNNQPSISNVLYVEVYDRNFKIISRKKVQIINGKSVGSLEIPTDVITANYYIRAYTQYMRNFKKELFYTNQLTIINPDLPSKDSILTVEPDTLRTAHYKPIEIQTDKETFSPRSLVTLNLLGNTNSNLSVSVVKHGSCQTKFQGINSCFKENNLLQNTTKQLAWIPETRAVSISGKVIDSKTNLPVGNCIVYACTMDSTQQFHITRTQADGSFIFSLPNLHENHTLYLSAQEQQDKEVKIIINNDFSLEFPTADYSPEVIDSIKKALINQLFLNKQLSDEYSHNATIINSYMNKLPNAFDEKSTVAYLKDYIALDNMKQVLLEIASYVSIKDKKGKPSIEVFDKKNKTMYSSPLILVDNIPFQDDEQILSIAPAKIVSVKIISEPYIYGNEIIYGIVRIQSVAGNLAGMKLPASIAIIDYITFNPAETISYSDYIQSVKADSRLPDFRNTLYWNPNVSLAEGKQSLQFYTSDCTGDYDIIVRGVNNDGELFQSVKKIKIVK